MKKILFIILVVSSFFVSANGNRIGPSDYDTSGFDVDYKSYEELMKEKRIEEQKEAERIWELESRINYPDFWGEKPPENEFDVIHKPIGPVSRRVKFYPIVDFEEANLILPKSLNIISSENYRSAKKENLSSSDILFRINEFNSSINKKYIKLNQKKDLDKFLKEIEVYIKYIESFYDKKIYNKKEFYENYGGFMWLKDNFDLWLNRDNIENKDANNLGLMFKNIEKKFNKKLESLPEVKLFKSVSGDDNFSFNKYIKEKNIEKNKGLVRRACLENESVAFLYSIIVPLEVTSVDLNVKDLIKYVNLNSYTRILVEFKNYKEYFLLKDIKELSSGLREYNFKQIGGSDYFHFSIKNNEFIVNDHNFFVFKNFPESNRVRNKGEEYYKVVFRNNKGYIYNKEIKKYEFSCKGPFDFID